MDAERAHARAQEQARDREQARAAQGSKGRKETPSAAERGGAEDACALCGAAYGDDEERDDLWIACDTCSRWFHGDCAGATQVCSGFRVGCFCPGSVRLWE